MFYLRYCYFYFYFFFSFVSLKHFNFFFSVRFIIWVWSVRWRNGGSDNKNKVRESCENKYEILVHAIYFVDFLGVVRNIKSFQKTNTSHGLFIYISCYIFLIMNMIAYILPNINLPSFIFDGYHFHCNIFYNWQGTKLLFLFLYLTNIFYWLIWGKINLHETTFTYSVCLFFSVRNLMYLYKSLSVWK